MLNMTEKCKDYLFYLPKKYLEVSDFIFFVTKLGCSYETLFKNNSHCLLLS